MNCIVELQLNIDSTFSLWYNLSNLGPPHKVYVFLMSPPPPPLTLCPSALVPHPMCKWPKENAVLGYCFFFDYIFRSDLDTPGCTPYL